MSSTTPPPLGGPDITRLEPAAGPAAGGTPVAISGALLTNVTTVVFGTSPTPATQVAPTLVRAVSPPGPLAPVQVYVIDNVGNRSNSLPFVYQA